MADGDLKGRPLQSFRARPGATADHCDPWLPEVRLVVGRDAESSGLSIELWEPTGGQYPRFSVLYSARWASPIHSTQEALEICLRGLTAALAELFNSEG